MIRRPPRSTLFPSRRSSDLDYRPDHDGPATLLLGYAQMSEPAIRAGIKELAAVVRTAAPRSEEHTSELQSHVNLVCRLLLEKKKKNNPLARPTGQTLRLSHD